MIKKAIYLIVVFPLLLVAGDIILPYSFVLTGQVIIEDYVVGSKYEVVSINGNTPHRIQHGLIISKVPLIYVKPGSHQLQLKREDVTSEEGATTFDISHVFEKGKKYRIVDLKGRPNVAFVTD